jgi:hypothetical protein
MARTPFFPHLNLRRVSPFVWSTLFVQIAIAAPSLAVGPFLEPFLSVTDRRTFLMHPQNLLACRIPRVCTILFGDTEIYDHLPEEDADQPSYPYKG